MSVTADVRHEIDAAKAWQEDLYTHLDQHPDVSMEGVETSAEISRRLESAGYQVHHVGGGVVGVLDNGQQGGRHRRRPRAVDRCQPETAGDTPLQHLERIEKQVSVQELTELDTDVLERFI